jgi:hypothetical protein
VGFLDSRFQGYGVGHAEWTTRLKRAGYGYKEAQDKDGRTVKANLYINGGLEAADAPTFKDRSNVAKNEALFDAIKREPVYRNAWSTEDERIQFLNEQAAAGVPLARVERASEDASLGHPELAIRHFGAYEKALRRMFGDHRSFVVQSGWLQTLAVNIPAYRGQLVPWFNYCAVDFLIDRVQGSWEVFEYGAGYSTLWWASHTRSVVAVEHDEEWTTQVQSMCSGTNATVVARPADSTFVDAIDDFPGRFDVVVVDGFDRPSCVRKALPRLKDDGVLILDNSDRPAYRASAEWVTSQGFKELRMKGPAPMTIKAETTSFFYRPDNCFDL